MANNNESIIHSVIFSLKHPRGSDEEIRFLEDGRAILASIPAVSNFQVYRQVSPKNDFSFGFSMEFANQADYEDYNAHAAHEGFVKGRWIVEVEKFLEIDYQV